MSFQLTSSTPSPQQMSMRHHQNSSPSRTNSHDHHTFSLATANNSDDPNTSYGATTAAWTTANIQPDGTTVAHLKTVGTMTRTAMCAWLPSCCCKYGTWVWACFHTCAVCATIFSILCALVYQGFVSLIFKLRTTDDSFHQHLVMKSPSVRLAMGVRYQDWQTLLWGTAISAVFAFVTCFTLHVGTLVLLLCSLKSLGHPGRRFGRGFVVAASLWTSLHILNIALQFHSFGPLMMSLASDGLLASVTEGYNASLLATCTAIGYLTCSLYMLFSLLVQCWREQPTLLPQAQVGAPASWSSASVGV